MSINELIKKCHCAHVAKPCLVWLGKRKRKGTNSPHKNNGSIVHNCHDKDHLRYTGTQMEYQWLSIFDFNSNFSRNSQIQTLQS
jgi:hypothetical protein